jgi:hypothetical protein
VGLTQLLTLPRFDEQASRDVVLDEDRRRARFVADNSSLTEMKRKQKKKWALPLQAFTSLFLSSMKNTQMVAHYPLVYHNTAYVQRRMYAHATTVVHFLIESEPSTHHCTLLRSLQSGGLAHPLTCLSACLRVVAHTGEYFCVSVACEAPRAWTDRPVETFAASLFSDGDVHTYGEMVSDEYIRLPISLILPSVLVTFNAHVD